MKEHQLAMFVLIAIVIIALGGLYFVWKAQKEAGLSYAGIKALGEIYQKRYEKTGVLPGQPTTEAATAIPRAQDGACCVSLYREMTPMDIMYQEFNIKTGQRCIIPEARGTLKIKEVKGGRCPE